MNFLKILILLLFTISGYADTSVRLLSYNVEYGAEKYSIEDAVKVVKDSNADVAVINEAHTHANQDAAAAMAQMLGWHHLPISSIDSAIISRWPLEVVHSKAGIGLITPEATTGKQPFYVVAIHLNDFQYQPFQAASIPYKSHSGVVGDFLSDAADLIQAAIQSRGHDLNSVLDKVKGLNPNIPIVIAGDFNEPSHLDWTEAAVKRGLCPVAVEFPASKALHQAGFCDAFRCLNPNEVENPGHTWSTHDPGYEYRNDRIDFIYVRNRDRVADVAILSTPSDHYAVVATVIFGEQTSSQP